MQQFPPPKQGTVSDEIQRLEGQSTIGKNILKTVTEHHAYIKALEPFLENSLKQLEQITPKLDVMMPPMMQSYPPNIGQVPPMQRPLQPENFVPVDPRTLTSKDIYEQYYAHIRNLVNQAPPSDEGKDIVNDLHVSFKQLLSCKDKLQMARLQQFSDPFQGGGHFKNPQKLVFGSDHLTLEKANEFSSLFKIPPNIISNKEQRMIDARFPTKQAISYIEEHFERENADESLRNMHNDLNRTQQELLKELKTLEMSAAPYDDFLNNPPLDVVRESPDYQNYKNGVELMLGEVKDKSGQIQDAFEMLMNKNSAIIQELLQLDFDPVDEKVSQILNEEREVNVMLRKIYFVEFIIEKVAKLPKVLPESSARLCAYDKEEMSRALNAATRGDMEEFERILNDYKNTTPKLRNKVTDDIAFIKATESKLTDQLMEIMKRRTKAVDKMSEQKLTSTMERVDIAKKRVVESEKQIEELFAQIREKYGRIVSSSYNITAVPKNMELMLNNNAGKISTKRWYERRIKQLEKQNAEGQKKLEQIKAGTEQVLDIVKQKHEQMDVMGRVKINKNLPRSLEEMKGVVNCPLCGNKRDTIVLACGHTFCNTCAKGFLTKRNRNCPSCQTRFTQYDLKQYKYDLK